MAALVSGCDGSDSNDVPAKQLGPNLGQPVRLASCRDWAEANVRERYGTIEQIKELAGGPVPSASGGGRGATLPDDKAYDLFENWCSKQYARGFRLYKLYARAAGFSGE